MYKYLLFFAFFSLKTAIFAQEYAREYTAYGVKGGMTMGFQRGEGSQISDVLFLPLGNGSIFTEMYAGGRGSLCFELGYHERGSGIIQQAQQYIDPASGRTINFPAQTFQRKFSNIVFQPAFKQIYDVGSGWGGYYMLGARVEYTVKDTLPFQYNSVIAANTGLNRFNYGIMLGGGFERRLGASPLMVQVEFQAQPDFSQQIQSPPFPYYDPYQRQYLTYPAQKASNITFELTLGFKFVEYPEE
jgi:hypothetical protein